MIKLAKYISSSLIGLFVAIYAGSFVFDGLRIEPEAPSHVFWDETIKPSFVQIDDTRLRYIKTGNGPNLVLLHTFSTDLSQYHNVIPGVENDYTVYAPDLPGFGFSDNDHDTYGADLFVETISAFLNELAITDAIVVGESIGGSIALALAANNHPSVKAAIAVNPTGYANEPLGRSSISAKIFSNVSQIPVLSGISSRYRNPVLTKRVLDGAVYDPANYTAEYLANNFRNTNRKNFARVQKSFFKHSKSWVDLAKSYTKNRKPVMIIWGEDDWSYEDERSSYVASIPNAKSLTIEEAGHFITQDKPEAIVEAIRAITN